MSTPADARGGLFPALLRHWRSRHGLSQLDLALAADVSSRHISFLETGRSVPSAEMVLRLAATLDVPLRDVNAMLRAAGHPPHYAEPEPAVGVPASVRFAIDVLKRHHDPYPLVVIDGSYEVLDVNDSAAILMARIMPASYDLAARLPNLARFTFDPHGGGRVIVNHDAVARELLGRMHRELLADPGNRALRDVLDDIVGLDSIDPDWRRPDPTAPSTPTQELQLRVGEDVWSFLLMVTTFQAPFEVALDEIRIESWFPVDELTAEGCASLLAS